MNTHIEQVGGGLKCDNSSCNWEDPTIKNEELASYVNTPCPKCGENVLTQEDYQNVLHLYTMIGYVNSLSIEELDELVKQTIKIERDPILDKLKGLDVNPKQSVIVTFDCHKKLRISDIKLSDEIDPNTQTDK